MGQPDHDRLPPEVNATVDQFLAARAGADQPRRMWRWWPLPVLVLVIVVNLLLLFAALAAAGGDQVPVVVVTPSPYSGPVVPR